MTRREQIAGCILQALAEWDAPANAAVIQAQVAPLFAPPLLMSEFDESLGLCERSRWIAGIRTGTKGVRWGLTDEGRAELMR